MTSSSSRHHHHDIIIMTHDTLPSTYQSFTHASAIMSVSCTAHHHQYTTTTHTDTQPHHHTRHHHQCITTSTHTTPSPDINTRHDVCMIRFSSIPAGLMNRLPKFHQLRLELPFFLPLHRPVFRFHYDLILIPWYWYCVG